MEKLSATDRRRLEARIKVAAFYNVAPGDLQHLYLTELYRYLRLAHKFFDATAEIRESIEQNKKDYK